MHEDRPRDSGQGKLLRGAAILGLAAVISKLLGTLQKIPLQNIAGDEVFGIYNAVYPLYIFILTLASAGFPIAVSKFVADYAAQGNLQEANRVFRLALRLLALSGLAGFAVLYAAADGIAAVIGLKAAAPGIRSVSFALLAAPAMAAVRGYFQGLEDMVPTAVTQVVEQFVRVAVMIILLFWLTARQAQPAIIAAGAAFGSAAGALAGLAAALWLWWRKRPRPAAPEAMPKGCPGGREVSVGKDELAKEGSGRFFKRFAAYAIPVCIGTVAMPVLTMVDVLTIPRVLVAQGLAESAAAHRFGLYNHGLPLVQLVVMIATSMAAALVPSVAQAVAAGDRRLLAARTGPVLRFTWLAGLGAAFGLAATALPVNAMLFSTTEGWQAMTVVSFTALFATLHVVTGCMLQGLGAVAVPARSLFVAAGVKAAGNLLLVPALGIEGAAIAAVLAYAAAFALNLRTLRLLAPQAVAPAKALLRPAAAALAMALAVLAVEWCILHLPGPGPSPSRLRYTAAALAAIAAGAAVYIAALFRWGAVRPDELALLPEYDSRWKPLLLRLRLIPQSPSPEEWAKPT